MGASAGPHGPGLINMRKQLHLANHLSRIQNHRYWTVALQHYIFSDYSFIAPNIKNG